MNEKVEKQTNNVSIDGGLYEKEGAPNNQPSVECPMPENISTNNPIRIFLTGIAVLIYLVGFVLGIGIGSSSRNFDILSAFIIWAASGISGTIFLGFAEIIKLLQAIKDKD